MPEHIHTLTGKTLSGSTEAERNNRFVDGDTGTTSRTNNRLHSADCCTPSVRAQMLS